MEKLYYWRKPAHQSTEVSYTWTATTPDKIIGKERDWEINNTTYKTRGKSHSKLSRITREVSGNTERLTTGIQRRTLSSNACRKPTQYTAHTLTKRRFYTIYNIIAIPFPSDRTPKMETDGSNEKKRVRRVKG